MYPANLNHPLGERKLILGDTPIFHWTMIIGGRVLSVILRIQFWKQEYPLNVLECKTHQPMSARPKACLPIAYRPTCALGSTTVQQWHVFESSAVNSCGDIFIFFLLEGQRKKWLLNSKLFDLNHLQKLSSSNFLSPAGNVLHIAKKTWKNRKLVVISSFFNFAPVNFWSNHRLTVAKGHDDSSPCRTRMFFSNGLSLSIF